MGTTLKVTVLGRAKTGKSYLVTRFIENRNKYEKLFCSDGSDYTFCIVKNVITACDGEDYMELCVDGESVLGGKIPLDDVEFAQSKIDEFRDMCSNLDDELIAHIEVYLCANSYTKKLLMETRKGNMQIIDTPGVSEDKSVARVKKAPVYIIVLRDEQIEEVDTLKRIAAKLDEDELGGRVIFILSREVVIRDEEHYEKEEAKAIASIRYYLGKLGWFGEVKEKNCLMYPLMEENVEVAERIFLDKLKGRIWDITSSDFEPTLGFLVEGLSDAQISILKENIQEMRECEWDQPLGANIKKASYNRIQSDTYVGIITILDCYLPVHRCLCNIASFEEESDECKVLVDLALRVGDSEYRFAACGMDADGYVDWDSREYVTPSSYIVELADLMLPKEEV